MCEEFSVLGRISAVHVALENGRVPDEMEVGRVRVMDLLWRAPEEVDGDAIAAAIVIGNGVQWHVEVADKMDDVANGIGAFARISSRILQGGQLIRNGLRDTALRAAELGKRGARRAARNIDVVPGSVFCDAADVVGPSGGVGKKIVRRLGAVALQGWVDRIFGEQFVNELECFGSEILFGEQRDGLMAFATPGAGRGGG